MGVNTLFKTTALSLLLSSNMTLPFKRLIDVFFMVH